MAEMQKMTKDEALAKVAQGVGSIYSKEDVVNLINSITIIETASITEDLKDQIAEAVAYELRDDNSGVIGEAEFDISQSGYGGSSFDVELIDVELDECRVADIVREVLDANLDSDGEEAEEEKVEETVED
jgi:hypothetical protein